MNPTPSFITVREACQITGHATPKAFGKWLTRQLINHPEVSVARIHGRVHRDNLDRLMRYLAEKQAQREATMRRVLHDLTAS